jgi:guanylate kinase
MAKILIIDGYSGSGKSTVSDALMTRYPSIIRAVAVTTRLPRAGERYGYHYYFVDNERFDWLNETEQLLEHTTMYGNHRYGTLKISVEQALERGKDVLFVCNFEGVQQIQKHYPDAKALFLAAPDEEELRIRLLRRGTMGTDLEERIEVATKGLAVAKKNHMQIVVNDVFEDAMKEVEQYFGLKK